MTHSPFGLGETFALIHREHDLSETTGSFSGVLSGCLSRLPPLPQDFDIVCGGSSRLPALLQWLIAYRKH